MIDEAQPPSPPEWGEPRTRTVTWFDPALARQSRKGMTGIEFLTAMLDGRIAPPPITGLMGYRLASIGDGVSEVRCVPTEAFYNPIGLIHGGLLCTLMDTAMGIAVQTQMPVDTGAASIELKVSFLRPVRADGTELEVRGRVLKVGRKVAFSEAHAYDSTGALIGHATSSLSIVATSAR